MARGLCLCGCGQEVSISKENRPGRNVIKGEPVRFVPGHRTNTGIKYESVDLGYETECWSWRSKINENGYGRITLKGVTKAAHVLFWEQVHGSVPEGMELDHLCHDPATCELRKDCPHRSCVNPDHLRLCTRAENAHRRCTNRLSVDQVIDIYQRGTRGAIGSEMAEEFGVHKQTIYDIITGRSWTSVTGLIR